MSIFQLIDKLFALLMLLPPAYIIVRFVRWYFRQGEQKEES